MPWFKVDDTLAYHAKIVRAGNAAVGMWARAGAWCSQQLTDGFVPDDVVTTMGRRSDAQKLVDAGLWIRVEGGYQFHQWSERQPSRESVEADRAAAKERQRRAREAAKSRGSSRGTSRRDSGVTNAVTHDEVREQSRSPRPDPTRPVPEVPSELPSVESSGGGSPTRTPATGEPPQRCPRHTDRPADGPCGPCGDARRAHDRWQREADQARRDRGVVVGGHRCPDHPDQPAGRCGRCDAARTVLPDGGARALLAQLRDAS